MTTTLRNLIALALAWRRDDPALRGLSYVERHALFNLPSDADTIRPRDVSSIRSFLAKPEVSISAFTCRTPSSDSARSTKRTISTFAAAGAGLAPSTRAS